MSFEPVYKLREWIPERFLDTKFICANPRAFRMVQKRKVENISWNWLSKNTHPGAVHMIEQHRHLKTVAWDLVSANPSAVYLLKKYPEKIKKYYLNSNPEAIYLLEKNPHWIVPDVLSCNKNGLELLEKMVKCKMYHWNNLCGNPSTTAIKIIKNNISKIDFEGLSRNTNPEVIPIIRANIDKCDVITLLKNPIMVPLLKEIQGIENFTLTEIEWQFLFCNDSEEAIELIRENFDKIKRESNINLGLLSLNPAIFILDKDAMMRQIQPFAEDLISTVLHPTRVHKYMDKYNYNILEDEYCNNNDEA